MTRKKTFTIKNCAHCGTPVFTCVVYGGGYDGRPRFEVEPVSDGNWVYTRGHMAPVELFDNPGPEGRFRGHWETCAKAKGPIRVISTGPAVLSEVIRIGH